MSKVRIVRQILLGSFLLAGSLLVPTSSVVAEEIKIRVGVPAPMSGDFAILGDNLQKTAQTYQKRYLRHPISFVFEDAKRSSAEGLAAYRRLVDVEKVDMLIGGTVSNGTIAGAPVVNSSKTVLITPLTGGANIDKLGSYVFRIGNSDILNGKQQANEFITHGLKRVALLTEQTEYTADMAANFREEFQKLGGTLLLDEDFSPSETDFRTQILKLRAKSPQALFMSTQSGLAFGIFLKQLHNQAADLKMEIHTNFVAASNPDAFQAAGEAIYGVHYLAPSYDKQNAALKKFFTEFQEDHKAAPSIPFHAAGMVDALNLLQEFLDRSGSHDGKFDREGFQKFLLTRVQNYSGLMGTYSFDAEGNSSLGFEPAIIQRTGTSENTSMKSPRQLAEEAKKASRELARLTSEQKAAGLLGMAEALQAAEKVVLAANAEDMAAGKAAGLSLAMLDRLMIDSKRLAGMVKGIRDVAALPDGVGEVIEETKRPNGLLIQKVRVPIGVIVIIYESRPNVTADASALCLRTGNAVILRGGSEALRTNLAIAEAMRAGGARAGFPADALQVVPSTDRQAVNELVKLDDLVDLVIPRGGEGLIRAVMDQARVPVIKHYKGVCHIFVDESAEQKRALEIIENAKCQRPGVCNAVETILVHEAIAKEFLPIFAARMFSRQVEMRGDEAARSIVPMMKPATEADWFEEYLDLVVAVRVVRDVKEAVEHINHYGSHHSDSILTSSLDNEKFFLEVVDSAVVYANASTRFTDGGEFGMGAEIGISTDKLHARGPMGLRELTTYKYVVHGAGQVRV